MAGLYNALIAGFGAPIVSALAQRLIVAPMEQELLKNKILNYPLELSQKKIEQAKSMMAGPEFTDYQGVAKNPMLQSIWANLTPEPAAMMRSAGEAQAIPTALNIANKQAGLTEAKIGTEQAHAGYLGQQGKNLAMQTQLMPAETQAKIGSLNSQAAYHLSQAKALEQTAPAQAFEHLQQGRKISQEAENLKNPAFSNKATGVTALAGILGNMEKAGIQLDPMQRQLLQGHVMEIVKGLAEEYKGRRQPGQAKPGQLPIGYGETLMEKYQTRR